MFQLKNVTEGITHLFLSSFKLVSISGCIIAFTCGFVMARQENSKSNICIEIEESHETIDSLKRIETQISMLNSQVDWLKLTESIGKIYDEVNAPPPPKPIQLAIVIPKVDLKLEEIPEGLIKVSATAYNMGKRTAHGTPVRSGVLAASVDLIKLWGYDSTIVVYSKDKDGQFHKYGEFILEDQMHQDYRKTCDIYMTSVALANKFGRQTMWIGKKK